MQSFYNGGVGTDAETVSQKICSFARYGACVHKRRKRTFLSGLKLVDPTAGDVKFSAVTDKTYINFTVSCVALDDIAKRFKRRFRVV
ncbi:MAG: hypothetical protein L6V93_15380 [Clostridiales bacterium]|nr:MAG: hypothetical protein L6V93_15380 [Clostridiales bacterium]